jgi:hypothetical protein
MLTCFIRSNFLTGKSFRGIGGDRAGVVHTDIDATEALNPGRDSGLDIALAAHVADDGDRNAAGFFDRGGGGGVYGARQFRM